GEEVVTMAVLRFPHVDTEALLDAVRDLSRDIDTSRLVALRDDLGKLELPHTDDLRRELDRLDLPDLSKLELPDLSKLELPDISKLELPDISKLELPDLGRLIGRPARRAAWSLPVVTPAVVAAAVIVLAGAAVGGVLAWLYQPGCGAQRRKAVRRRLRKVQRMAQHSR
ncbi:MAG: hypothetical protein LH650_00910, partial [Chloroflexi bacterium]|nr:hypothetical protein [Chloroflexota bacterium]